MKVILFVLVGSCVILFLAIVSAAVASVIVLFLIALSVRGTEVDGFGVVGFVASAFIVGALLSTLSLLPSYLISMKLARWLREKHGWPINRPRRLFAYAVITPVILVALFFLIASVL